MDRLKLGQWLIEFDRAATMDFYSKHHLITEDCSCSSCRNYVKACEDFPVEVLKFFDSLGIIPAKEAEVYQCCQNEDGTYQYGGFYHVVGRLIEGSDCWIPVDDSGGEMMDSSHEFKIDGFFFGFTYRKALVPKGFPEPVLQMEFQAKIPWIIEDEP